MERVNRFCLLLVALLIPGLGLGQALPRTAPQEVGVDPSRLERVGEFAEEYVDEGKLPGVLTLVARRGSVIHFETTGYKDLETREPLEADTIFRIYSMTKPITTVAALILYERGHFRLTDPVSRYIPELEGLEVLAVDDSGEIRRVDPEREMTIQDLMRHTAGFSYGLFSNTEVDRKYREAGLFNPDTPDLESFVQKLADLPLLFSPGERMHYSVSVDVLGYLIEVVSGQSLDQFFEENIFEPLEMVDTGFSVPDSKLSRFATCYGPDREAEVGSDGSYPLTVIDQPSESRYRTPVTLFSGGGGLVSTAGDYLRFLQMLLNGGELEGRRILGPKTVDLMFRNHLPPHALDLEEAQGYGFGLGLAVLLDVARSGSVGTEGEVNWAGYASTLFWIDPEEELIAILMSQFIPYGTYPLREDFKAALYPALVD